MRLCFEFSKPVTVTPSLELSCTLLTRITLSCTSKFSVAACFCHVAVTLTLPALTPVSAVDCNSPLLKAHAFALPETGHTLGLLCRLSTDRSEIRDVTLAPSLTVNDDPRWLVAIKDSF